MNSVRRRGGWEAKLFYVNRFYEHKAEDIKEDETVLWC